MNELLYVYCLTNSLPDFSQTAEFPGLKCMVSGSFFIVVKTVSETEFSEENLKKNLADIQWLEPNVREHIKVITLLMEQCTIVPFKFGTIYQSEERLVKFAEDYSDSLIENLLFVEWKEEWAVKIYCDRKALSGHIDDLSDEAAELEKQIMASSPGKAFLLKRKKEELIENEMDRICKNWGQDYYNEFKRMSSSTCLSNLLPKEFSGRNDHMILNAAFLVSKDNAINFVATARMMKMKNTGHGFDIEISGPWPPFSFISIKEKP